MYTIIVESPEGKESKFTDCQSGVFGPEGLVLDMGDNSDIEIGKSGVKIISIWREGE